MRGIIVPFLTGLFKKYLLNPFIKYLKRRYEMTERELAIWLHYKNKAMNHGHSHKKLSECDDGLCQII